MSYLKITRIQIVVRSGHMDDILLLTDLPDPCYPFTGTQTATMKAQAGKGESYCAKHFPGTPIEVLNYT